jgi:hypothetical protein|tara:strand:+ start:127 stop:345 length:219 start_codon:yes stop_codon:yes gene_type:complete
MPKVDVHLGFTFRVGPHDLNQYSRVDVTVGGIDTGLSIDDQLAEAHEATGKIWEHVHKAVDTAIEEVLDGGK